MSMYNYSVNDEDQLEYIQVANVDELPEGGRLFIDIDGEPIVIFKINGQYYSIADVCSHDDGPVGEGILEGFEIICPRHGAHFDVRTGKVLALPAFVDIPAYPIRINADQIEIGIPVEE
jgi:3-phenylpropionate/trans-cinnamate dioxygenase ferredoxin subunit